VDALGARKHPNCAYKWVNWVSSPKVQAAAGDLLRRDARQHEGLRGHGKDRKGLLLAVSRKRAAAYFATIKFWKTPVAECGNGQSNCMDYSKWQQKWTEEPGSSARSR